MLVEVVLFISLIGHNQQVVEKVGLLHYSKENKHLLSKYGAWVEFLLVIGFFVKVLEYVVVLRL